MWEAYASDDGVPIVVGDKVLDGSCCSYSQMVATDEVGWKVEFGGVRARLRRPRMLFGGVCIAIC